MSFANYLSKIKRSDEDCMRMALQAADKAVLGGDSPIGACLVWPSGHMVEADTCYSERDPTAHAIMNVIRKTTTTTKVRLGEATLYCTVEPCPMCVTAARLAGIKEIVFGAYDTAEGVTSTGHHDIAGDMVFKGGVLSTECVAILPPALQEQIKETHA